MEPHLKPWAIEEREFPQDGSVSAKLAYLVGYAVLAPSGHNTQPWLFALRDDALELRADLSRSLPVVDPDDRELIVSCGAALQFAIIAARHFGYEPAVEILQEGESSDLLARLRLSGAQAEDPLNTSLFAAITMRRTNRLAYSDRRPADTLLSALRDLATAEGAGLSLVESPSARDAIADLIEAGNRAQFADPAFRQELSRWMHPNRSKSEDGMPGYAHGIGDLPSLLAPMLVRRFDMSESQSRKDRKRVQQTPVLAVFTTPADTRLDWLRAGRALANVLLRARADGVWASFFNQPIEVPELRLRLQDALASPDQPQLLFRLGYGEDVRPTPRRSRQQVLR